MDKDIMPHRSNVEFVRGAVALAEINTWAVSTVSSYNFQTKWHVGRARPEVSTIRILSLFLNPRFALFYSDIFQQIIGGSI